LQLRNLFRPTCPVLIVKCLLRIVKHDKRQYVAADLLDGFLAKRMDKSPEDATEPRRVRQ
jgi:hypothetical protein